MKRSSFSTWQALWKSPRWARALAVVVAAGIAGASIVIVADGREPRGTQQQVLRAAPTTPTASQRPSPSRPRATRVQTAPASRATSTPKPRARIFRISVSSSGRQANGLSEAPTISSGGRYVAFASFATNLAPDGTNGSKHIFVHDRRTGTTELVSVSTSGEEGRGISNRPSISADGRFVAFDSDMSNLVPGDTNDAPDVFVHDRETGETRLVSRSSSGEQGSGLSPVISAHGRRVAFCSVASTLVPGDTNERGDVFAHDLATGETRRVSVSSQGEEANNENCVDGIIAISADGRYVAFPSAASNLVPGDDDGITYDVFVHDLGTGRTRLASVGAGIEGGSRPAISADGRFVAFEAGRVYVRDMERGVIEPASGTVQVDAVSRISISASGRYVAFIGQLPALSGTFQVFLRDRKLGTLTRVSVSPDGKPGNGDSGHGDGVWLSPGAGYLAFQSDATNLVPGDTNGERDIFVWARNP